MKRIVIIIIMLGMCTSIINAVNASENNFVGNWKYEVPTAPYGYQKGILTIQKKDNEYKGYVTFESGYKIDFKEVKVNDGKLKIGLYIDYEYVSLNATIIKDKISGTVQTPEGEKRISAIKQTK